MSQTQQEKSPAVSHLPVEVARSLLTAVVEIADNHVTLAGRREAVVAALLDLVQADAGCWAWGRGWPLSSTVAPVAVIYLGVSDQQRCALMEWALDAETDRTFRSRVGAQMGNGHAATTIWQDIFSPEEWAAMPSMRRHLSIGGWSSWLHSVRYTDADTWCNFFLLRNPNRSEFGRDEAAVVNLVLASVPWLHSMAEEYLPPETFVGLTPRQRTVMLMLLDGLARKTIALRLGISADTVGDHLKSIYAHFGVSSSGELAALFLRGR